MIEYIVSNMSRRVLPDIDKVIIDAEFPIEALKYVLLKNKLNYSSISVIKYEDEIIRGKDLFEIDSYIDFAVSYNDVIPCGSIFYHVEV